MKILIINIDHNYRSVYTGLIAASLRQKIPTARITGLLSSPNDFLDTTGAFENLKFIDPGNFFQKTKDMQSQEIEKEMKSLLGDLINTEWGVVINLSSNLLGSLLANFLKSKEGKGAFLSSDFESLKQSDLFSHALSELSDKYGHHLHFSYLYRNMLRRFEGVQLTSSWPKIIDQEFTQYFDNLLKEEGKSKFVLVDADIADAGLSSEKEFMFQLFKNLKNSSDYLPVLVGLKVDAENPVVKHLKENLDGKLATIQLQNKAKLSVIGLSDLVITDDVYLKSIADIRGVKSILLTDEIQVEDFSIIEGSLQIVLARLTADNGEELGQIALSMLSHESKTRPHRGGEVYMTRIENNIPFIVPVGHKGNEIYQRWLLGLRFFVKLLKTDISLPEVDKNTYRSAIEKEKEILHWRREEGIFGLARDIAGASLKNTPLQSGAHALEFVTEFLKREESL